MVWEEKKNLSFVLKIFAPFAQYTHWSLKPVVRDFLNATGQQDLSLIDQAKQHR